MSFYVCVFDRLIDPNRDRKRDRRLFEFLALTFKKTHVKFLSFAILVIKVIAKIVIHVKMQFKN